MDSQRISGNRHSPITNEIAASLTELSRVYATMYIASSQVSKIGNAGTYLSCSSICVEVLQTFWFLVLS